MCRISMPAMRSSNSAASWSEAADKARYLLNLFAATPAAQDPRRQTLIAGVLADFARLAHQA